MCMRIYLHSNMFLLIPSFNVGDLVPFYYLHSNMFLLIRSLDEVFGYQEAYLHSNMFLLIRCESKTQAINCQIYIPICFY